MNEKFGKTGLISMGGFLNATEGSPKNIQNDAHNLNILSNNTSLASLSKHAKNTNVFS